MFFLKIVVAVKAVTTPYPKIVRHDKEKRFFNPSTSKDEKFPSIEDSPTVSLSVIVPAYEEEQRCKY